DLTDVPTLVLPRRAGDEVHGVLRPGDALPPGFVPASRMRLERLPAGAVLPRLRVTDAAIELLAPDGSATAWTLSPADQAALRAEVAEGRVGDRFLAHAASRLEGLDDAAMPLGTVDPMLPFEDTLPNRPARWLYRLRAVDAAGRPSARGQILPLVVQVPSPARCVAPTLEGIEVADGGATVRVRARGTLQGQSVFVFHATDDRITGSAASLATIRNRDDLPPLDRLVVRDQGGRRLVPTPVPVDAAGEGEVTLSLPVDGIALHVWALALSVDGVPSRLVGPLHASILGVGA
ncbi:MAG TPA: hypothetical protein VK858_16330, partial [Longimicrobiales bacterium]|nr:hypothetical protein [Longimicrobiales bacterium]